MPSKIRYPEDSDGKYSKDYNSKDKDERIDEDSKDRQDIAIENPNNKYQRGCSISLKHTHIQQYNRS